MFTRVRETALAVAALCLPLFVAAPAFADGKHKKKATIKNEYSRKIRVDVFNGNDGQCENTHGSDRKIEKGQTKSIKCHPKGKNRCKVSIYRRHGGTFGGGWKLLESCKRAKGTCKVTSEGKLKCN